MCQRQSAGSIILKQKDYCVNLQPQSGISSLTDIFKRCEESPGNIERHIS